MWLFRSEPRRLRVHMHLVVTAASTAMAGSSARSAHLLPNEGIEGKKRLGWHFVRGASLRRERRVEHLLCWLGWRRQKAGAATGSSRRKPATYDGSLNTKLELRARILHA